MTTGLVSGGVGRGVLIRRSGRGLQQLGALAIGLLLTACASERPKSVDMVLEAAPALASSTTAPSATRRRAKRPTGVVTSLLGISVGEPLDTVEAEVGGPIVVNDEDKERAEWVDLGYQPAFELPFEIGFDKAVTFNQPTLPVYMVFSKNELVTLIRFSAYVTPEPQARKAELSATCGLLATPDCVEREMGSDFLPELVPEHRREIHHYLSTGFSVTFEADAVRVIDIYGVLSEDTRVRVKAGVLAKQRHGPGP